MLLSCTFNTFPCNSSYFTKINISKYGPCYFFNRNTITSLKSEKPGRNFGLSLELYIGAPNMQPPWISTNGIVVAVSNRTSKPVFAEEEIKVKGGQETNLMLTREVLLKLPYPFSNCIENVTSMDSYNSIEYKMTFLFTPSYRQKLCVQKCAIEGFSTGLYY